MKLLTENCYKKSGVYLIKNLINNKVYVGSSNNLGKRQSYHYSALIKNKHFNQHLQNSYNKYGGNNFEFNILEYCLIKDLAEKEQYWIDALKASNKTYGFNFSPTAYSLSGRKQSQEEIEKRTQKLKGRKFPPEFGLEISKRRKGIKFTKEHLENMSAARKGKPNLKRRKTIYQYTVQGEFITSWIGGESIKTELGLNLNAIYQNIKGKSKTCGGFIWKLKMD